MIDFFFSRNLFYYLCICVLFNQKLYIVCTFYSMLCTCLVKTLYRDDDDDDDDDDDGGGSDNDNDDDDDDNNSENSQYQLQAVEAGWGPTIYSGGSM